MTNKPSEVELPYLVQEALKKLSKKELEKMEHCVGFDRRKVYHRKGFAYFKPHRNYFNPGGTDCEIWARKMYEAAAKAIEAQKYMIRRQDVIDELMTWDGHCITDQEEWHLRQVIGSIKSIPGGENDA